MQITPRNVESPKFIQGPAGKIEAMLCGFGRGASEPSQVGVVCHPHPLHQGTMDNKVVTTVQRAWQEQGLATIRFNFRGVGASEGFYGEGVGEADDLRSILDFVKTIYPESSIWLAGFSFGAYISLKVAREYPALAGLVSLGLPLSSLVSLAALDFAAIAPPVCPWLILHGEQDELCAVTAVQQWYQSLQAGKSLPETAKLVLVPEASHFFHGFLNRIKSEIIEFMNQGNS